jgi:glutamyl-tRNA(Gln) amidotransferase subunit E
MNSHPRELGSQLKPPSDLNPRAEAQLDFPDRDFARMTDADYAEIGFMGGLEVHQQLDTATKLFCRCPSGIYVDHYDAEVLRHMRPTLSELGEYDGTALMEFKTKKEIIYRLERSSVCTYEIDDTPPFEINEEAVKVSLEVCDLFGMDPVSELHVMRKQYLDGSIPTGFQRTAMIALGGVIPFRVAELGIDRELTIRQLSLEEDSCREVSDVGHRITFRTDRLGMPLTEVVTEPEFLTPLELQAGARLITHTTRACPRVLRGPGAARQDVNVSVAGGRRTEIKGVSNHRILPRLVHNEGFRQLNLLRIREELRRRGVDAGRMDVAEGASALEGTDLVLDATTILRRSDYAPLRDAVDAGGRVYAVRLPGFGGLLVHRTQPGVTFASEIVDRVRVIACLVGRPFMLHSDIEGYGLRAAEWKQIHNALGSSRDDSVVVVFGPERDCDTAAREVLIRAQDALVGVPSETRQAMPDGTTGFERILPGADRMYPDTDTPPMPIPDAWVTARPVSEDTRPNDSPARTGGRSSTHSTPVGPAWRSRLLCNGSSVIGCAEADPFPIAIASHRGPGRSGKAGFFPRPSDPPCVACSTKPGRPPRTCSPATGRPWAKSIWTGSSRRSMVNSRNSTTRVPSHGFGGRWDGSARIGSATIAHRWCAIESSGNWTRRRLPRERRLEGLSPADERRDAEIRRDRLVRGTRPH